MPWARARRAAALVGALFGAAASAEPCSTAACSLSTRTDDGRIAARRFVVDISYRLLDQDQRMYRHSPLVVSGASEPEVLRPLVDYAAGRFLPGYHHDWGTRASLLQVDVGYGLSSRLGLLASLPVWTDRTTDHLYFPGAGPANHSASSAGISRVDLRTGGFGDAQLALRYAATPRLLASLAVRAPTGPYRRKDESGQIADPMVQSGTGAWGVLGSVQYGGAWAALATGWAVSAAYQRSFTNDLGYRYGDELFLTSRASRRVAGPVTATLQAKAYRAARNVFLGQPSPSTGTLAVYVGPGLRWAAPGAVGVYANVQIPVYQHVNESQLAVHTVLQLGLSRTF